jgi:AraC family transcriptional regulator
MIPKYVHLYASRQPHSGGWKKGHGVIVFQLSPQLLEEAADELSCGGQFEIRPFKRGRDRIFEEMGPVALEEYLVPDRPGALYAGSIGNVLAGYIVRNHAEARVRSTPDNGLSDKELRIVRRFMEERMEMGFSVAEVAGAIGIRPQRFARKLYVATGLSPWQFVERHRFSIAKWMLKNRRIPLADIACRLGFADQSHFTNVFRRMSGVTPSAFRRES